ncbi:hypothetical protein BD779DRAFT_1608183 [Infundibulicybe gibba]|nr:hypothetical protein BD779DRAFT_1608183 [Infundibulicybe gibba]
MEGSQADVVLRTEGDPTNGLIGSALSLPQSHEDNPHIRILERDDLHHDDIVEHLDHRSFNAITKPFLRPPAHPDQEKGRFEDSLDRHVDDIFNRPSKIKRTMMVFWGAAIVVFLIKIINFHNANTQGFWVEVSSQVENGLFTVTGIGLIPSRVLDTYRIYKIWYYKRRTKNLRAKAGLPQLFDIDDLPDPAYDPNYVHVLTDEEQQDLHRQQVKFQYHQTWYRAHGTETHRASSADIIIPSMALLICCLNDGNSIFQVILCGTMWGLNRFERPAWSTGILIPCSFLCGIFAAIFIWRGGQQTKRIEQVEERLRAALAREHPIEFDTGDDGIPEISGPSTIDGEKQPTEAETVVDEHMTVPAKVKF